MLDEEVVEFVGSQRLGYVATVSPDGGPNISPKGTILAHGSSALAFADIRSPDTVRNIRKDPRVEINVIDPVSRRGYLFGGRARVAEGAERDALASRYVEAGIRSEILHIVVVDVEKVDPVTSPLYDLGMTEDEIRAEWKKRLGL